MLYGVLPPEINSARMWAGPGAGSMLAAAGAWDDVAIELGSTATSFDSVLSALTSGPWLGAASVSMAAAAAGYVAWLTITAAQAEQTASQAKAAVASYEMAFAMTVPPPRIAANRAQQTMLIATNLLGQNAPAIAATEAQYGQMWAQDAVAMYHYAATSASATVLTPFTAPSQTTNPAGVAVQDAAVGQASVNSVASNIAPVLSDLVTAVPSVLSGFGTGMALPGWLEDLDTVMSIFGTPFFVCTSAAGLMMSFISTIKGMLPAAAAIGSQVTTGLGSAAVGAARALGSGAFTGVVSAGAGEASRLGLLSVPPAWAASAPTLSPSAVAALPRAAMGAAPSLGGTPGLLGGMPMAAAAAGRAEAAGRAAQDGIIPLRVLPQVI